MSRKRSPERNVTKTVVPLNQVQECIFLIRGLRVITDVDLAQLYGVTTKRLNEQVRRNVGRFPPDFVFQLTWDEADFLRSQIATMAADSSKTAKEPDGKASLLRSQNATLKRGKHLKYRPFAFTEHGAIMSATVLKSPQAVQVSLLVVRAFVKLRDLLATHRDHAERLHEHDRILQIHDSQINHILDAFQSGAEDPPKPPIGFQTELQGKRSARALPAETTGKRT